MTLRHLRIFITVYETGSTTVTARKLHIAQPSVSLAISEMEKYYNIRLFDRMSRRLYVTDTGRRMYEYAKHIISLFDSMEESMFEADSSAGLNIGSTITIGSTLIPVILKTLREKHPEIRTKTTINKITILENMLHSNEIDIGLVESLPEDSDFIQIPFMEDEMSVICAPDDSNAGKSDLPPDILESTDFLLRDKGSAGREIVESLMLINNIKLNSSIESVSPQAIIAAVSMGVGYSILPRPLVEDALNSGIISTFTLKNMEMKRVYSIVYHKNKYLSQSAEIFIDIVKSLTTAPLTPDAIPGSSGIK